MQTKIFNEAQLELLNTMAVLNTEEELFELKKALSLFFAKRVDDEMDKLWEEGKWNDQTLKDLENAHYRTPYK